jgi:hypothetical protein
MLKVFCVLYVDKYYTEACMLSLNIGALHYDKKVLKFDFNYAISFRWEMATDWQSSWANRFWIDEDALGC